MDTSEIQPPNICLPMNTMVPWENYFFCKFYVTTTVKVADHHVMKSVASTVAHGSHSSCDQGGEVLCFRTSK